MTPRPSDKSSKVQAAEITYDQDGGALVTVVLLAGIMTLVLGTMSALALQNVHSLRLERDQMRALTIAEAGLNQAFGNLASDPSLASGSSAIAQDNSFADGSFVVTSVSHADDVYLLTSVGQFRERESTVRATVSVVVAPDESEEEESTSAPLPGPFGPLGLFAGGNLTMSGGIQVNIADLSAHANGSLNLTGGAGFHGANLSTHGNVVMSGNPQIHLDSGNGRMHADGSVTLMGNIQAAEITSSTSITGNWGVNTPALHTAPSVTYPAWFSPLPPSVQNDVDQVAPMPLPELDIQAYLDYATANTYFYDGDQNLTRSWITADTLARTGVNVNNNEVLVQPAGGILFVNGNVTVSQDIHVDGVIVATGDITLGGGSSLSNPTEFPALISTQGNIVMGGGATGPTIDGWVYAMNGNVSVGGGASGLTGIIAAHNLNISAGFTLGSITGQGGFTSPGGGGSGGNDSAGGGGQSGAGEVRLMSWLR